MADVTTLASFDPNDGSDPAYVTLVADSAGDLFGTAQAGGIFNTGAVFELVNSAGSYTLETLLIFNGTEGQNPLSSVLPDAAGDLFLTTAGGGSAGDGAVVELVKTASGYAPTTLLSFSGLNGAVPTGALIADAAGDLFGTTSQGGPSGDGAVFELVKGGSGYTLTTLLTLNGDNGANPNGALLADAAGDLFGTTAAGGPSGLGTVFELVRTAGGYTPVTLASFDGTNGASPYGSLLADAAGDLFGTTAGVGAALPGSVFELVKTADGYTLSTLFSFNGANGSQPYGSLIMDAAGDLFGVTQHGGTSGDGTVFELVNTPSGYTLNILVNFNGANGADPVGTLTVDAAGDLFGTTYQGGAFGAGSVFEVTNSGFVVANPPVMTDVLPGHGNAPTTLSGTAEASSTVQVFDGSTLVGTATADASGDWILQANVPGNTTHVYTETATDSAGNTFSSTGETLFSQKANVTLTGGSGDDVLIAAPNDVLTGGGGHDAFVFNPSFGRVTITDFDVARDAIDLSHLLFSDASQLLAHATDSAHGAVITLDANDTITLTGVSLAQLQAHAADFHFF